MITFRCGGCAGVVQAGPGQAGRAVKCQRCGHPNICPEPSVAGPASRPRSADGDSRTFWMAAGAVALVLLAFVAWAAFNRAETHAAASAAATPADARQRELLQANLNQPGDPLLGETYLLISAKHFRGALPAIPVRWEPRLDEVGKLAGNTFTLEGMFGHIGAKAVILLSPALQADERALRRALCHEIVHAHLYATGNSSASHGAEFQMVLKRLSDEGAFAGIVATDDERANLRAWLDAESSRLDAEHGAMTQEGAEIERERADLERALADLHARVNTASAPDAAEVASFNKRREAYNWRVAQAQARTEQDRTDLAHFNREVERYNLMLVYPDGMDAGAMKIKR